jgi:DNA-binding beta-propeller fold protein YncE
MERLGLDETLLEKRMKAQSSKLKTQKKLRVSTSKAVAPRQVRLELGAWSFFGALSFVLGACFLSGCAPADKPSEVNLHSRFFSRAEIIGSRGSSLGQFNKPRSLAVDRADNLYVVDMTGRVQKFSPGGEFILSWQFPQTDLGKPKGTCTDANGNIVVVEPHYQRVNHFTPGGTLVEQWGRRGTNAGELILPRAAAVNSRGNIFISEYTTVDRVQGFRAGNHQSFLCFGQPGSGNGEFNRAEGLCIGPDDRIYVADSCNHRIQIFSASGHWLRSYGKPGRALGQLSYPYDVRVDRDGRQYVCEFGNSRIQIFNAEGRPLEIIGGPGIGPGEFNNPWSIALDSHGNLYVADSGNHRVQKLVRH